jgi:tetratricopeptide (TPR) repeat protein
MYEEDWSYQDEQERLELVRRFEDMIARNESYFFDTEEFEALIEYYLERNRLKQARHALRYAQEMYPDSTAFLLREVQVLASSGKLSKAIPRLKNLLRFEPQNEEVLLNLANIYSQLHDHRQAILYLEEAMKYADEELRDELWIELALEHENLDQWDKAIETLKEAIVANPENEMALYEMAYCFDMANQNEASVVYFEGLVDEQPYSFPAWYNLGNIFMKLERHEEALRAYDFCLVIQEDFTPAYLNKANALVKLNRYEEAISVYEELNEHEPPQASTLCCIGECHERLGALDEANRFYARAIELDSEYADAWVGHAVVADLEGNTRGALPYFDRAMGIEPENIDFKLLYAGALKKLERFDEAKAVYDAIQIIDAESPEFWMDYADLWQQIGEPKQALALLETSLEHVNDTIDLRYRMVACHYQMGKHKAAYALLEQLLAESYENSQSLLEYLPELADDPHVILLLELYKDQANEL